MSDGQQPLLAPPLFREIASLVERYGITSFFESGTGPSSSGMEVAKRLGLMGYTCDVFLPCAERAHALYPDYYCYHADSLVALRHAIPMMAGPAFFWLDGHCPTDQACISAPIFPPYEEMVLIKELKPDYAGDVFWLDDIAMITDPENPTASKWDVFLGGPGERWFGDDRHTWDEYLAVFADTHDAKIDDCILKLTPKG